MSFVTRETSRNVLPDEGLRHAHPRRAHLLPAVRVSTSDEGGHQSRADTAAAARGQMIRAITGDCRDVLATMPDESVHCCVTSPPFFGLRDYGVAGQIGLEPTIEEYVSEMVGVFREVKRVLRQDGTLFLNLGDSYFGGGRGGGGSYGPERRGWRVAACDTADKAPGDYPVRDCLCQNLCDACRAAYRIGKSHSGHSHASMQLASSFESSRVRTESRSDHPPTLGSVRPVGHNSDAILDPRPIVYREGEPPRVSLATTIDECAQQPVASRLATSSLDDGCRLCGRSLRDCVPASVHMAACTCGTEGGASADRRIGRGVSGSAYRDYTTAFLKPKDLCGIPWRVAFALQADGWFLRQDIIWSKPNPMPESVTDRCTKAHEYLFLLTKSARYYWDAEAVKEPATPQVRTGSVGYATPKHQDTFDQGRRYCGGGSKSTLNAASGETRNKRSVWTVATEAFEGAHFAVFPPALIEPCILAGTSAKGCCAECGAPWVRNTERQNTGRRGDGANTHTARLFAQPATSAATHMGNVSSISIGWSPTCKCGEGTVPCTILDPFGGAGTTGLVADRLQRNAVLIELNPTYVAMAEYRIRDDAPLFFVGAVTGAAAAVPCLGQTVRLGAGACDA
jgi:DNA modification methylase